MTRIEFNDNTNLVEISFFGDNFDTVLRIMKKYKEFTYDPKSYLWTCSPKKFISNKVRSLLKEYDNVHLTRRTMTDIKKNSIPKKELVFQDVSIDLDLVNYPPLLGKVPNETYQKDDLDRFIKINRGAIFWEQGLGKSYFMAVLLSNLLHYKRIDKSILITPSEGLYNIRRELLKFSKVIAPEDISIATKENREPFTDDTKIVIMTYRTFLLISDHFYKKNNPKSKSKNYRKPCIPFDKWIGTNGLLLCDESHYISNPKARQTKVIDLHKEHFEYRYIFTGTPANKHEKYYSQLRLLDNSFMGEDYSSWLDDNFELGDRFSPYTIKDVKPMKFNKFLDDWSMYLSRRLKKDHLDLPPSYVKPIFIPLNKKQDKLYKQLITQTLTKIKKETGKLDSKVVVSKFQYLTQALENPCLFKDTITSEEDVSLKKLIDSWKFNDHSKLPYLDDLVTSIVGEGEKLIIWDWHPKTIEQLKEKYKKHSPLIIHGETYKSTNMSREEYRDYIVETFKKSKHNLLIASPLVLSTAVTMVECSKQVYFSRNYVLTDWLQSKDRIDRYGQQKEVTTYVLILENSLEVRLHMTLRKQEDMNKNLVKKVYLSKDQWKSIFTGGSI